MQVVYIEKRFLQESICTVISLNTPNPEKFKCIASMLTPYGSNSYNIAWRFPDDSPVITKEDVESLTTAKTLLDESSKLINMDKDDRFIRLSKNLDKLLVKLEYYLSDDSDFGDENV